MSSMPPFLRGHRGRVLLGSVAGLVVAGVVIGLLIAWLSTSVLNAVGLDTSATTAPPAQSTSAEPSQPSSSETPPTTAPSSSATSPRGPTLTASPASVGTYDPITLRGRFPGLASGTSLQIERRENGSWVLFPVGLTSGAGGSFSTFIQTGHTGENEFRVSVPGSALSTPTVIVTVG